MGLTVKQQRDKIRYEKHITKKKIKKKKPKPKNFNAVSINGIQTFFPNCMLS